MTAHAVRLAEWADPDHFLGYFVVWNGDHLYQLAGGSPRSGAELRRSFPGVIVHPVTLSQRGGWIRPDEELVRLMLGYPEFYEVLTKHYPILPIDWDKDDPRMELVNKVRTFAESMVA